MADLSMRETSGYGPEEAYCKTHDPAEVKRKQELRDIEYARKAHIRKVELSGPKLLEVLKRIAEGHNDAMGLAQETLTDLSLW